MFLRINFKDNDFSTVVQNICDDIMHYISREYSCKDQYNERIKKYEEYKNKHGIENIRKAIVLGSYGYLITIRASEIYDKIEYDFSEQQKYIKYFDDNILIEEVNTFDINDNNSETCYIDFYNLKVYIL